MSQGITQKAFAEQINKAAGYVTQLKNAGRLVLDEKGKVLAEASIKRIEETADPSKVGVVKRHAEAREAQATEEIEPPENAEGDESFNFWKTKNERLKFESAHRESQVRDGELFEVEAVKAAVMDSDAIIRNRLESMPDLLAPQLAVEDDEHKVRIILIDQIEWLLSELSKSFKEMSA